MKVEISTLGSMGAWGIVYRYDSMNDIDLTWDFKCKHYPGGLIQKFKAQFCARGNQQLEGIDLFETYAPVVQWKTVLLMFIFEVLLVLKSKQDDVTTSFIHEDIPKDEKVYFEIRRGFEYFSKN